MERDKLVSIIIPAYNVEDYLDKCLETVLNQTYKKLEIILVDDGSQDDTGRKCDRAKENDSRIRVIHKDNEGLSAARNDGVRVSEGDYICFLDADDGIHSRFVEKLVCALETYDCDIAQCDYYAVRGLDFSFIDSDKARFELLTGDEAIISCYDHDYSTFNSACMKIYRRKIFDKVRFPIGKLREDEHTTWKLLKEADRLIYIHEYLYLYTIRDDSIMGNKCLKNYSDGAEAFWERASFFYNNKKNDIAIKACNNVISEVDDAIRVYGDNDKESKKLIQLKEKAQGLIKKLYYGYEFPFSRVRKDSVVAIYGAGQRGEAYYSQLCNSGYVKEIIWVDTYALRGNKRVVSIDNLFKKKVDYIIIAVNSKKAAKDIKANLVCMGFDQKNIID